MLPLRIDLRLSTVPVQHTVTLEQGCLLLNKTSLVRVRGLRFPMEWDSSFSGTKLILGKESALAGFLSPFSMGAAPFGKRIAGFMLGGEVPDELMAAFPLVQCQEYRGESRD